MEKCSFKREKCFFVLLEHTTFVTILSSQLVSIFQPAITSPRQAINKGRVRSHEAFIDAKPSLSYPWGGRGSGLHQEGAPPPRAPCLNQADTYIALCFHRQTSHTSRWPDRGSPDFIAEMPIITPSCGIPFTSSSLSPFQIIRNTKLITSILSLGISYWCSDRNSKPIQRVQLWKHSELHLAIVCHLINFTGLNGY